MTKIITAINNPELNKELKRENNIELMCKDIQYKEGILEMLEENVTVDYIIIDEKLPGEINIEELIEKIIEINEKIKIERPMVGLFDGNLSAGAAYQMILHPTLTERQEEHL